MYIQLYIDVLPALSPGDDLPHSEGRMIKRASKRRGVVPLTEARVQLFQLVEDLLTGRTDRVALSHRNHDDRILLVRASDVARMEAELTALRDRVTPTPRPLRGMGRIVGSAEDVLVAVRAHQSELAEAKLRAVADGGA